MTSTFSLDTSNFLKLNSASLNLAFDASSSAVNLEMVCWAMSYRLFFSLHIAFSGLRRLTSLSGSLGLKLGIVRLDLEG